MLLELAFAWKFTVGAFGCRHRSCYAEASADAGVDADRLIQVELVRAPEGSVVGERVRVEGSEGEPLTPAQVCVS